MSPRVLVLMCVVLTFLVQGGCAARKAGEDLGGGFTRVSEPAKGTSDVEGVSHDDHLYFRGADLGNVGFVSVAPSGRYAIFERNGDIFLIASDTGNLKPVTDGKFSMPKQVGWYEADKFAQIEYHDDHPTSRVELQ